MNLIWHGFRVQTPAHSRQPNSDHLRQKVPTTTPKFFSEYPNIYAETGVHMPTHLYLHCSV